MTPTGCGTGNAQAGPFYCPADQQVYIDLSFYRTLRDRFGAGESEFFWEQHHSRVGQITHSGKPSTITHGNNALPVSHQQAVWRQARHRLQADRPYLHGQTQPAEMGRVRRDMESWVMKLRFR